jgi:hypothetical protein
MVQKEAAPNRINPGFYIKFGPVFPVGIYATGQTMYDPSEDNPAELVPAVYMPAKMGAAMDLGFLIYIGPSFANKHLRLGIDATFISFSFNSIKSDTLKSPTTQYWYYYMGQKFGPVISICPVDRLVIDLSYKLNAYAAYVHHDIRGSMKDEWGKNLTQSEISMNVRYSLMMFSLQYNFGKCAYNDFDSAKPTHYVENSTYRVLIGFKF